MNRFSKWAIVALLALTSAQAAEFKEGWYDETGRPWFLFDYEGREILCTNTVLRKNDTEVWCMWKDTGEQEWLLKVSDEEGYLKRVENQ